MSETGFVCPECDTPMVEDDGGLRCSVCAQLSEGADVLDDPMAAPLTAAQQQAIRARSQWNDVHHMDLIIRRNGQDEYHEADWLKTAMPALLAELERLEMEVQRLSGDPVR